MPDINDLLKPVPIAFDYPTFRYYLELDVLQDTAKFLDWTDVNLYLGGTSRTTLVTGTVLSGTTTIVLDEPTPIPILGGSKFYYTGVDYFTTLGPTIIGDTEIPIVEAAPGSDKDVTYTLVEDNLPYRNVQHIYDAMTDEVLLRMGYTNPLQVPSDRIREMMLLGRIEAWRAVARNTVTDVDINFEDKVLIRSQFHTNAIQQWNIAAEDYNKEFGGFVVTTFTTPDTRTYSGAVKARW